MKILIVLLFFFNVAKAQDTTRHNPVLNCGDAIPLNRLVKGRQHRLIAYSIDYRITNIDTSGSFVLYTRKRALPTKKRIFRIIVRISGLKSKFTTYNLIIEQMCVSM